MSMNKNKKVGQEAYKFNITDIDPATKPLSDYIMAPNVKTSEAKDDWRQKLFNYMSSEHNVILLQSDMDEIENIINPKVYPYTL